MCVEVSNMQAGRAEVYVCVYHGRGARIETRHL